MRKYIQEDMWKFMRHAESKMHRKAASAYLRHTSGNDQENPQTAQEKVKKIHKPAFGGVGELCAPHYTHIIFIHVYTHMCIAYAMACVVVLANFIYFYFFCRNILNSQRPDRTVQLVPFVQA